MRLKSSLLALIPAAFLATAMNACDTDSVTGTETNAPVIQGQGGFAFGLDLQTIATVRPYVDSLRIELRKGNQVRTLSAALDSSVRISDLENGTWTIGVGLYANTGILKYYGSDTVIVKAGEVAQADIHLRPASGSVDILIHIDTTAPCTSVVATPAGHWYLQEITGKTIYDRKLPLNLDSNGLSGTDGCNTIFGSWGATDSTLTMRFGSTKMYCFDSAYPEFLKLPLILAGSRRWNIADGQLWIWDSLGNLVKYGNAPSLHPTGLLTDSITIQPESNIDTSKLKLSHVTILDMTPLDSSTLELTVQLPHPNLKLRLLELPAIDTMPAPVCFESHLGHDTAIITNSGSQVIQPQLFAMICSMPDYIRIPTYLLVGDEGNSPAMDVQVVKTVKVVIKPWNPNIPATITDGIKSFSSQVYTF
jgi:heat shock protein HslJ